MKDDIDSDHIIGTVEFRDDGRYEITCPKGHSSITLLQQQKFELLFDIGAYAIVDGYYREAVSSFTSSLERFYEFFIKVVCVSKKIEWNDLQDTWKKVSNQSERQLGAFIFLYLQEFGEKPDLLPNSKVKFRNEVIHKGKIPTKDEALNYGQAILDVVRPTLKILKKCYEESIQQVTLHHLSSSRLPSDDGKAVSTLGIRTIISLSWPSNDERTLETALSQLPRR